MIFNRNRLAVSACESLCDRIDNARSLDELADFGAQFLWPTTRRSQIGDSEACCARAWLLWARTRWIVAAAPDGLQVLDPATYSEETHTGGVFEISAPEFTRLQMHFAKQWAKALALAPDARALERNLFGFKTLLVAELADWCDVHWPSATVYDGEHEIQSIGIAEPRVVSDAPPRQNAPGASSNRSVRVLRAKEIAALLLGDGLSLHGLDGIFRKPAFENSEDFAAFCAHQAEELQWETIYFERKIEQRASFSRPLSVSPRDNVLSRAAHSNANDSPAKPITATAGNREVLADISPVPLGDFGRDLAQRFGFRSVSVAPFNGAHRVLRELNEARLGLEALGRRTGLPDQAIGLGGIGLTVAVPTFFFDASTAAQFSHTMDFRNVFDVSFSLRGANLVFGSSFANLAHEWSHAWDHFFDAFARQEPQSHYMVNQAAIERLRDIARFDKPASPQSTRLFRTTQAKYFTDRLLFELEAEPFTAWGWDRRLFFSFIQERGTSEARERARSKQTPREFHLGFRKLWRALRDGNADELAQRTHDYFASFLDEGKMATAGSPLRDLSELVAIHAVDYRTRFRRTMAVADQHPQWGPMRWQALAQTAKPGDFEFAEELEGCDAWLHDSEFLARAAESFFFDAGEPALAWFRDGDLLRPQGIERAMSDQAFSVFFEQTRPLFEAFAARRVPLSVVSTACALLPEKTLGAQRDASPPKMPHAKSSPTNSRARRPSK